MYPKTVAATIAPVSAKASARAVKILFIGGPEMSEGAAQRLVATIVATTV